MVATLEFLARPRKYRGPFHLSFVSGDGGHVASAPDLLISEVKSRRYRDTAVVEPPEAPFPRLHLEFHEGHGLVVQCFEDEASWGWFLVSSSNLGLPTVEINLGGQALERWPKELFVSDDLAVRAIKYFLESGEQDPRQQWVRIDAFPRTTIWEGRPRRDTWERDHPAEPNIG